MGKRIGVFVTGGIAAYKVPQLIRDLIKAGHEVQVVMTQAASQFVTATTLATVSKHPVLTDELLAAKPEAVAHVAFAKWLELALVVPLTANTLAKMAHGIADNALTSTLLAFNGPKLLVPAMNDQMWLNPATQANVAQVKAYGMTVLDPATGFLAEGYQAVGRMPALEVITTFVASYQPEAFLAGTTVLISAGGTKERLDPVRYLSNDSSGKMGTALANVAAAADATVTLVTTANLPTLPQVQVVKVADARQMAQAMQTHFGESDIAIMAAAVADYRPSVVATQKMKKANPTDGLHLDLVQNPDILKTLGEQKTNQVLVGFAAETTDLLQNAQAKLVKKHADLLVANPVGGGKGFNQATNTITILRPNQAPETHEEADKLQVAQWILKAAKAVRA